MSIFETSDSCCENTSSTATAYRHKNRPGLSQIAYRVGQHSTFKSTMLDALGDEARLSRFTTRNDDDPTIALVDGWASILDVLSFYQERIANEGFLGTAKERRSVLELARAIGYELNPGVAASTYLAFTLEKVPASDGKVIIDKGLKVQSIPLKDELPQTFETEAELIGSVELNEIRPRLSQPQQIDRSTNKIYLQGMNTGFKEGDLLLLVGSRRESSPFSEKWDVRTVHKVDTVPEKDLTIVSWRVDLGHQQPSVTPADNPRVYRFDRRASQFGFNAPDWRSIPEVIRNEFENNSTRSRTRRRTEWPDFENQTVAENRIDLDQIYEDILVGDWVLLDKPNYRELYRAERVLTDSRRDYSLTGKVTSIILDMREHLSWFPLRNSSVFTASREVQRAQEPVTDPVFGDRILLDGLYPDLEAGRVLILEGQKIEMLEVADRDFVKRRGAGEDVLEHPPINLYPLDNSESPMELETGDQLIVDAIPTRLDDGRFQWQVTHNSGVAGTIEVKAHEIVIPYETTSSLTFEPEDTSHVISQVVYIKRVEEFENATLIILESDLENVLHRESVKILANVVYATHGESRSEAMAVLTGFDGGESIGSGDNANGMQSFNLLQAALTYVPAQTPSGGTSTLEISVDGLAWNETPSLFGQAPDARVYSVRHSDDGRVLVQFGDNEQGARLPTGRDNIIARYRTGIGVAGNLRERQISLLASRPLGVKEAINPIPSSGAQDPEHIDDARENAPLTVLTLDRLVSVQDVEDFSAAFAGISKAQATVLWNGESQLIHLTVAGIDGEALDPNLPPLANLLGAIDKARHKDQEILIDEFQPQQFSLYIRLLVEEGREGDAVLESVRQELLDHYRFENRQFGQAVQTSELVAFVQSIVGVEAVVLEELDARSPLKYPFKAAARARWDESEQSILPAELLTLDPMGIRLEEMIL